MNLSRIALSLILIVGAGGAIVNGTSAYFSDTESSTGNTFTAGAIDLTIDNESYYLGLPNAGTSWTATDLTDEKFFDFNDLKPGDWGEDTISIHVATNDAYMCANVTLTSNEENSINEPEGVDGDTTDGVGEGELAGLVNFAWWADDGDNVFEGDETLLDPIGPIGSLTMGEAFPLALADSDENIWTGNGGPILGNQPYYIGKAWCFGTMSEAPLEPLAYEGPDVDNNNSGNVTPEDGGFSCDGSGLDNKSQTDSLTADISFEAVQARNNPNFQCEVPETFGACENPEVEAWADTVVMHDQGKRKNGTDILATRRDPTKVTGPAETTGAPSDAVPPGSTFYSLGFNVGTTSTRSIIVSFDDNVIVNSDGADVRVYEVTGGVYPDESVDVAASQDGINWTSIATNVARDEDIDLGPLVWAKYIRVTDVTPTTGFEDTADGYDLDAVRALNCGVPTNNGPDGGPF